MVHRRRVNLSEVCSQNTVYSDVEQIVIKKALKTAQAGIHRLGTLRNNTGTQRRRLEDQICRCHIALAPYKQVPKEIWMYIFELHCRSRRLSTSGPIPRPVVLTQVCSAWRHTVLSMPKLWSDVHVGERIDLARQWLERAGNIPRALNTIPYRRHHNPDRAQAIWDIVCSFPFRKLHLTTCDVAHSRLDKIPEESFSPVEDLALQNSCRRSKFIPHHFPNLVSLDIHIDTVSRFNVPNQFSMWKKLRVLRLDGIESVSECLDILSDAPSVEDCTFYPILSISNGRSIKHTDLKILTLFFSSALAVVALLDRLTCPKPHTLILIAQGIPFLSLEDTQLLLDGAQRFRSLRSLNFSRLYLGVDISLVLERLPLLQVLQLSCEKITAQTVDKIGKGELGGCLRELHDFNTCNLCELIQICELRRSVVQAQSENSPTAIARLEKVSMMCCPFESEEVLTPFKLRILQLIDNGIDFQVYRYNSWLLEKTNVTAKSHRVTKIQLTSRLLC